jgi:hypothetical protein
MCLTSLQFSDLGREVKQPWPNTATKGSLAKGFGNYTYMCRILIFDFFVK